MVRIGPEAAGSASPDAEIRTPSQPSSAVASTQTATTPESLQPGVMSGGGGRSRPRDPGRRRATCGRRPASMARHCTAMPRHPSARRRVAIVGGSRSWAFSQRGHDGASRPTRSSVPGSNDDTTRPLETRPATGRQDVDRAARRVALQLDVEERAARNGAEDVLERRHAVRRELVGGQRRDPAGRALDAVERLVVDDDRDAVRRQRGRRTRGRRSPGRRARPRNAAIVFSGARRQSPRCASRSAGTAQPPSPTTSSATRPRWSLG